MIGYARVSMVDQNPRLQIDAMLSAGVQEADIYVEQASGGAGTKRPQFTNMLKDVREGDVLVIWKLDRLGRSVRQVLETFDLLSKRGVGVKVLTQPGMDTTTVMGRLIVTIMAAVAEMERDLIRERTAAGLDLARREGRIGGRKQKATDEQIKDALSKPMGTKARADYVGLTKTQFLKRARALTEQETESGK